MYFQRLELTGKRNNGIDFKKRKQKQYCVQDYTAIFF